MSGDRIDFFELQKRSPRDGGLKSWKDILMENGTILEVKSRGRILFVNGRRYFFTYPQVAKAVGEKLKYFIGV